MYTCLWLYVCMYVGYVCVHVCIYVCIYLCMYECIYTGYFTTLGLCNKKSSYKHVSDFGRLQTYDSLFNSRTSPRVNRVYQLAGRYF